MTGPWTFEGAFEDTCRRLEAKQELWDSIQTLNDQHFSQRQIGLALGIGQPQVHRWLKTDRPHWVLPYIIDENWCWLWQGAITPQGYGTATLGRRPVPAHRLTWRIFEGPIPDGLQLDHLCRVRRCVNPDHLEPVTGAENVRRGDVTKITREIAEIIRRSDERGVLLASRYGISEQQVCNIRKGRVWA